MKYSTIVLILLLIVSGCATTSLPERPRAIALKKGKAPYPIVAAIKSVEGYVRVSYDINEQGNPININVIESVPKEIFDKAAIKSISKWKYAPKVVNGQPVSQNNNIAHLEFKM
jgi:protein TonB